MLESVIWMLGWLDKWLCWVYCIGFLCCLLWLGFLKESICKRLFFCCRVIFMLNWISCLNFVVCVIVVVLVSNWWLMVRLRLMVSWKFVRFVRLLLVRKLFWVVCRLWCWLNEFVCWCWCGIGFLVWFWLGVAFFVLGGWMLEEILVE